MSLLRRATSRAMERRSDPITDAIMALRLAGTTAGAVVNPTTAMQLSTTWRCTHLLADIVGGLPCDEYEKRGGQRIEVTPADSLIVSPSGLVRPSEWRSQIVHSMALRGNGFAYATSFTDSGYIRTAEVLDPDTVQGRQPKGPMSPPEYLIAGKPVDPDRLIHFRAFVRPGSVWGMSILEYARRTMGVSIAAEEYGANWYADGGHPTSVLQSAQEITGDQAKVIKQRFKEATTGDQVAVLGLGLEYKPMQVSPADAKFLEAIGATKVDICTFFGIPPTMLDIAPSGQSVTYQNREQRAIDFLVFTLQWWMQRLEETLTAELPGQRYVKLNADALLRPDAKTRNEIYQLRLRNSLNNVDELRALDDQPPLPDKQGQVFYPPTAFTVPTVIADQPAPTPARED